MRATPAPIPTACSTLRSTIRPHRPRNRHLTRFSTITFAPNWDTRPTCRTTCERRMWAPTSGIGVRRFRDFPTPLRRSSSVFNKYSRTELGYKTDMPYYVRAQDVGSDKWDWGSAIQGFPDTASAMRQAIVKNPYLKILVMEGYYDLAD